jgi:chromosome segregation ATPase
MAQPIPVEKLQQAETEIAVLQVQYGYLTEKVEDIKTGLKDLTTHIDEQTKSIHDLIVDFQEENKKQHDDVNKKIASFEKWRWMLMGAGVLAGAIGWPTLSALIGM